MRVDNTSNTGWTEAARALEQVFAQLGDMLADIAQRYGISVDALRAANPGVGDRLAPGDAVRLPTAAELAAPQASVHTVRRGETLSEAADRSRRAADAIQFDGKYFRKDIGYLEMQRNA